MTAVNQVVDALYRMFTATILFPDPRDEEYCRVLCRGRYRNLRMRTLSHDRRKSSLAAHERR